MITREEMQAIEKSAIEGLGISSLILMENAALNVFYNLPKGEDGYLILAGVGNNGGDALALARHLINAGKDVSILIVGEIERGTKEFLENLKILQNMNVYIKINNIMNDFNRILDKSNIVIDGIFGTGLKRVLSGKYIDIVNLVNNSNKKVYSIDLPTGLDANEGKALGACIKADITYTMHEIKLGLEKGKKFSGDIIVCGIGISRNYKP